MLPMASLSPLISVIGIAAFGARTVLGDCLSFGMDFQNGKTYFQNSLSNDNFTFVSQFEGCNPDTAYNILVDPIGDQLLCSDTNLTPDNTDQLASCPVYKNELVTGNWSVIIISNNGDGDPIAHQRDFKLTVGLQSTSTFTPTVISTATTTPIITTTITTTSTTTSTLVAKTVTSPFVTITPTTTITPAQVTVTSTKALLTIKTTSYDIKVLPVTRTATASCRLPTKAKRDPTAYIYPTVGPAARIFTSNLRREALEERNRRFVEDRAARVVLAERAPDPQPLIITQANTASWVTITTTSAAPALTATITAEVTSTSTSTPPAVTVLSGQSTAAVVTLTVPTPTKTKFRYGVATSTITKSINYTYTISVTTTPQASKAACTSAGGIIS